jgi:hypothetical protein
MDEGGPGGMGLPRIPCGFGAVGCWIWRFLRIG